MPKEKILITVKTYPTLSQTYTELVCTAGFREDGSWIRIYPSPFRFLENDQQYSKYQWVELDLEKNPKDPRPESFRPRNIDDITLGEKVPAGDAWEERRKLILDRNKIYTNLQEIIEGANNNDFSLAIFKPTEILDFTATLEERDWALSKKEAVEVALKQGSLFEEKDRSDFKLMPKLPYKFKYRFKDDTGKESSMMVEDWEIGQLFWNCLKGADETTAIEKVKQKYLEDFAKTKDLHFFLGTTRLWHGRAPNPYVIIGTFHPKHIIQGNLF